jgi:predicted phosphodiesterase
MRIGLISDIHGNLVALDAVLAELDLAAVDQIICLGDLAVLGPEPAGVINRIGERGIATVRGNVDDWLAPSEGTAAEPPESAQSIDLTAWTRGQLEPSQIDVLRRLPMTIGLPIDGDRSLLCFHALPDSVDDITHADKPAQVGEWASHTMMACGHTHIQSMWRVGDQIWLNPGSVGLPGVGPGTPDLPRNRDVTWTEFAIVEINRHETSVDLRRLELDIGAVWAAARATDMPHQDWWLNLWRL